MISKYMDEQIERIRQMEHRLERATEVLGRLDAVLDEYEAVQEDLRALDQYLGSPECVPTAVLTRRGCCRRICIAVLSAKTASGTFWTATAR